MTRRLVVLSLFFFLASFAAWFPPPVLADGEGFETDTFTVASYPDAAPKWPCVARNAAGDFVVAWRAPDDDEDGIFARLYAADGTPRGDAFRVNDVTTGLQDQPSVALRDDGTFVVVWRDSRDPAEQGVYARLFDAGGNPEGASLRVDVTETDSAYRDLGARSVAILPDGGFVVTWRVWGDTRLGIFGRIFDRDGTPRGEPFQVAPSHAEFPSVDVRGEDIAFTWVTRSDPWGRLFDLNGVPRGDAFRAGEGEEAQRMCPEVRLRPSGDFVFAFTYTYAYYYSVQPRFSRVTREGAIEREETPFGQTYSVRDGMLDWRSAAPVDRWGRFLFVSSLPRSGVPDHAASVKGRRYDDRADALAGSFTVAEVASGEVMTGYATADGDDDGNVVIAWSHLVSSTEGSIEARLLCSSLDTVGPADTDACEGQRVELHAETRGRSPFSWQWRRDGTDLEDGGNLSGANTDTLVLDPVSSDDAGSYDCVVHDGCPDMQTYVTPAATLTVHGAIPEVPGLMLRKENMGADLHFTWQNVENAVDYVVRQDTEPDGPFDTVTGTADDGTEGLTVPMPEGEILFFEVHGRNPGCEGP